MTTKNKNVLWDTNNRVLAAFNPRLTNRPTNLALNKAFFNSGLTNLRLRNLASLLALTQGYFKGGDP